MDTHFIQLRPNVSIHQSEIFQTNTGILKTPEGFVLVDPSFTQADFARIAAFIGTAGVLAGFSTHAHYDHLFWSPLFGDETPRYCFEGTSQYIAVHRRDILEELIAFDKSSLIINLPYFSQHLYHLLPISTGLHNLNGFSIEVVAISGHLSGQVAFLFPEFGVLFAADTLSNTEPPSIEGSWQSLLEYIESLETLSKLIDRVERIVPGHGDPADPVEAKCRLDQDRRYLEALCDLCVEDYSDGLEKLAGIFLQRTGETRVVNQEAWQIHLANLRAAYDWLLPS